LEGIGWKFGNKLSKSSTLMHQFGISDTRMIYIKVLKFLV